MENFKIVSKNYKKKIEIESIVKEQFFFMFFLFILFVFIYL